MKKIILFLMLFIYSFSLELNNKVLEPEEAFKVNFTKEEDRLNIKINLGKDIYLYDDKIQINITKPKKVELVKELTLPKPVPYDKPSEPPVSARGEGPRRHVPIPVPGLPSPDPGPDSRLC